MNAEPITFAKALEDIQKDQPGVGDVHVAGDINEGRKPRKPREGDTEKLAPRSLKPIDAERSHSPFPYDAGFLGALRPDQQPRYYGAMTNPTALPVQSVPLAGLVASQDRVDHNKVQGMRGGNRPGKPLVIRNGDTNYIADGHHGLAASWMDGATHADVHFKDITDHDMAVKRAPDDIDGLGFRIAKVDEGLGLVFGWAIVCKVDGKDYYDLNIDKGGQHAGKRVPEHITEDAMLKAATDFMLSDRVGNEMHAGPDTGTYAFAFPMTTEIAKAMGITTGKTGLMVAYKCSPAVLEKFKTGRYTGFSVEGSRTAFTEHTDGN